MLSTSVPFRSKRNAAPSVILHRHSVHHDLTTYKHANIIDAQAWFDERGLPRRRLFESVLFTLIEQIRNGKVGSCAMIDTTPGPLAPRQAAALLGTMPIFLRAEFEA